MRANLLSTIVLSLLLCASAQATLPPTVDGAPLRPWRTRTNASLWVEVERRFRVRVHTASIVEVRVLAGGARGDIVIAPAGDQP